MATSLDEILPETTGSGAPAKLPVNRSYGKLVYLESIRGIAAFIVVLHHLLMAYGQGLFSGDLSHSWLRYLRPVVIVLANGPLSVRVFFVLSGFVLSLSFFRSGDRNLVSSAALRRYFRLVVPVFIAVMLGWGLLETGCYWNGEAAKLMPFFESGAKNWLGDLVSFRGMPFFEALYQGLVGVFGNYDANHSLNTSLWTMPIELAGSFLIFAVLSLFGSFPRRGILYAVLAVVARGYYLDFLCGIVLCDLYTRREKLSQPFYAPLPVALVLMGGGVWLGAGGPWPTWLAAHTGIPLDSTWSSLAATMIVGGGLVSPPLQRFLEFKPLAFLGKISFALYVVHMPIVLSLGCWFYVELRNATFGHSVSAGAVTLLCIVASWLAAWGLYYAGDLQGVRLGKWVERRFR